MTTRDSLRIGGVPEYFNLPIHLALEEGKFSDAGIDLLWQDVPEGTGKMVKALADDDLELAVVLTEGMVKSISAGNPSRIIHVYVQSPLLWGIHIPASSPLQTPEDLVGKRFAISRYGSGSHLMALLWAKSQDWEEKSLDFEVVNNLEGARKALGENDAQIFLWEKYTTQFLVDNGEFRRVGVFPTPWPCFVVAATEKALKHKGDVVRRFLDVIIEATANFDSRADRIALIVERYTLNRSDVIDFLPNTQWGTKQEATDDVIESVGQQLKQAGLLEYDQ